MTEYIDADALLADVRRKQKRAEEVASRARQKLGVRRSSSYSYGGMTAEEIERDTRALNHVLDVWRQIGKRSPSPVTLPSGQTLTPSPRATARAAIEYAATTASWGTVVIAGYEYRWQVEAQLRGFERERQGAQNARHLEAIAKSEAIFKEELERMDREGDYVEPEMPKGYGTLACVGKAGRGRIIA
jgi:hypothetical protein